jgi:hypothetical protein
VRLVPFVLPLLWVLLPLPPFATVLPTNGVASIAMFGRTSMACAKVNGLDGRSSIAVEEREWIERGPP